VIEDEAALSPALGELADPPRWRSLTLSLAAVGIVVGFVVPFSTVDLGGQPSFVPALLALIVSLDLLSAVLLIRQFHDSGDRRALLLASSYVFSLAVLMGYGAAFPGVLADIGPWGAWPSAAPWLWVAWHTGFPVLLACAVAPWPHRWEAPMAGRNRHPASRAMFAVALGAGALVVMAAVHGRGWLPVLIHDRDTSAMTRVTGPVILPLVAIATVAAVVGAVRLSGPVRWAALAATAALGDVVLTLFSYHRFSLGWYVGRSLTVVSCAVVLIAMLAEFGRLKQQLAVEADRLRRLLNRTNELEALHSTLLSHMTDGVMLHGADGAVLTTNPAAEALLGLSGDQLRGRAAIHPDWTVLRADGTPWPIEDTPAMTTLRTGEPQRDRMLGVHLPGGDRRWLRVSSSAQRADGHAPVRNVVTSLTDETQRHAELLAGTRDRDDKRRRIQAVLDSGGPQILVQPIVELRSGAVIGGEALSRFSGPPNQGPDTWFADAADVDLGAELELLAVRVALEKLNAMPRNTYLSVNVSPAVATSAELFDLLGSAHADTERVVLELTEHADVADYPALLTGLVHLRALGVRIAVDDTGAGFSSLRHILNLRPDIVKLDLDLVQGIHNDPARRALAAGLLVFAQEIGAYLVAEGIETANELAALRDIGVTHGQGYHLGHPAPLPMPANIPTDGKRTSATAAVR
jgi:PAS domain S-box-containing protein